MEKIYKKVINAKQLCKNAGVKYGRVHEAFKHDVASFIKPEEKEALIKASEKAHLELKKFLS